MEVKGRGGSLWGEEILEFIPAEIIRERERENGSGKQRETDRETMKHPRFQILPSLTPGNGSLSLSDTEAENELTREESEEEREREREREPWEHAKDRSYPLEEYVRKVLRSKRRGKRKKRIHPLAYALSHPLSRPLSPSSNLFTIKAHAMRMIPRPVSPVSGEEIEKERIRHAHSQSPVKGRGGAVVRENKRERAATSEKDYRPTHIYNF